MKFLPVLILSSLTISGTFADTLNHQVTEQMKSLTETFDKVPITITDNQKIVTKASFRPPVEITIVARTDSTNLRIGYAADEVIFNWELNPNELRVDGGPANGDHQPGKG